MPRTVTVTFDDGTQHVYQGVPDAATPDQVQARASKDFGKGVKALDGGTSAAPAAPQPPKEMSLGRQILGNAELGGATVANIPYGLAHAASDIYSRLTGDYTGKDPSWVEALRVPVGQAGQELAGRLSDSLTQTVDKAGAGGAVEKAAGAASDFGVDHPFVSKVVAPIATDVTALAGARVPLTAGASRVAGAVKEAITPLPTAEEALQNAALRSPQSMGSAAAAPSLQNVSPELKTAISKAATQKGGAVNADTLNRHIQADTLPVPIKLTEGQATQDPAAISTERNLRGTDKPMVDRLSEQNQQLKDNIDAIRDSAGPDVFTTNDAEHGRAVMGAYKAVDNAARKVVDQKYQALRDASGGQVPFDTKGLWQDVQDSLHQQYLYEHAPPAEMTQLRSAAEKGGMSFEQFEAMRTNLARTMRSATDGNTRAAAGVIRDSLEQMPLSDETGQLKSLADDARSAAKQRFQAIEADPAYKAVVQGKIKPENFLRTYVLNGTPDDVAKIAEIAKQNPVLKQTLNVAVTDYLKKAALPSGEGNFSQAAYNRALSKLSPALKSLVDPKVAEQLQNLGDVARYVQIRPAGSFVNESNTFTAAAGHAAGGVLEHAANSVVPFAGTVGRAVFKGRAQKAASQRALAPGAGLRNLIADTGRAGGAAPVGYRNQMAP